MRSQTLILPGERQEDFDRLAAGWRREYAGEGQATESMLERVILWDWFLKRAERRYMELECALAEVDPCEWTEEDHKQIELCLRYKTSHERSFFRAFYALRAVRKDKVREELALDKVQALMNGMAREILEKATSEQEPKVEAKRMTAAMWVEMREREPAREGGRRGCAPATHLPFDSGGKGAVSSRTSG